MAILRKHWMPVAEVERIGGNLGGAIRKVVGTIHLAAPTVVGVSVAEAEARFKELEDEILKQLHQLSEGIEDWKPPPSQRSLARGPRGLCRFQGGHEVL